MILGGGLFIAACGGATPPAPPTTGAPSTSAAPITVKGTESFAWDQSSSGFDDVGQFTFTAYVDDAAQSLPDAGCQGAQTPSLFTCSAKLPSMSAGAHRLQITAVTTNNGTRLESGKSAALNLVVTSASGAGSARLPPAMKLSASDGTAFSVETLATGLDAPSSLARTSDGRIFIAEAAGDIRVWADGEILVPPAVRLADAVSGSDVGLVGIAVDPAFDQSHLVYLAYTAQRENGALVNRVARFREVGNVFGERAIILEDPIQTRPQRAARIRFGPDAKLYVIFSGRAADGYAGTLLRLNPDGTTPSDNARYSPSVSGDARILPAFDWQPATGHRWQIARDALGRELLMKAAALGRQPEAVVLTPPIDPSGGSFYRGAIAGFNGDLFVADLAGRLITRVRFDPKNPDRVAATEHLLENAFGRIGDVITGSDGGLYFSTSNRRTSSSSDPDDDRLARIGTTVANGGGRSDSAAFVRR